MTSGDRFGRTRLLFGERGAGRIASATVMVVGLGAVGSYCVEALARSGIGGLYLADFDRVDVTNVNRQLYALESTLGLAKVEVAAERVTDIHPGCRVTTCAEFVRDRNAVALASGGFAAVVDAIDTLNAKVALCEAAVQAQHHVVSVMGAARRFDPTKVRVGDLSETEGCPLARFMRKRLKRRGITRGIRCVFSSEQVTEDSLGEVVPPELDSGRDRHVLGSYACVTGVFGLTAASEVLRRIAAGEWGETC